MYYFPYTNFHDINLDWIIEYAKSSKSEMEDLINQFENLIVQTTGDSTNKVMSQNAVTVQLNYLSSRINTLNTTVEELTAKLNEDIANLAEFETETASNFSSVSYSLSSIENALKRFYVVITHTATGTTMNVPFSDFLSYRGRSNVRYYLNNVEDNVYQSLYERGNPTNATAYLQTMVGDSNNTVYQVTISPSGIVCYRQNAISVYHESGQSTTAVMSQKSVTDLFESLDKIVRVELVEASSGIITSNYTYNDIVNEISRGALIFCDFHQYKPEIHRVLMLSNYNANNLYFIEPFTTNTPYVNTQIIININDNIALSKVKGVCSFTIISDGETIPSTQLTLLQNILNAIVVNNFSPQIYLKITTDNVTEQLYVDSANSTGYVLRNNNYIITYTTTPSVTIEPVEKVFTSSTTGIARIAEGAATGYSILKIIGTDVDLTNYYIVDADITNLIGGDSRLISVSPVSGVPVILIYTNAIAFSGSWTVTCRHK